MKKDAIEDSYKDFLSKIIKTLEAEPLKSEIQEIKQRASYKPKQIDAERKEKLLDQIKKLEKLVRNTKAYVKTIDI